MDVSESERNFKLEVLKIKINKILYYSKLRFFQKRKSGRKLEKIARRAIMSFRDKSRVPQQGRFYFYFYSVVKGQTRYLITKAA